MEDVKLITYYDPFLEKPFCIDHAKSENLILIEEFMEIPKITELEKRAAELITQVKPLIASGFPVESSTALAKLLY